jgi:iron(III) transport system ATP-binding protein
VSAQFRHRVKGLVYAARDVSLTIRPGELMTLLGPSGCGKTTTLRMIAGFQEPSAGRIHIGDRDVTDLLASDRDIGFVFQSYALFPHLTVAENVAYGLRVRKAPAAEIGRRVGEVLELVGLAGYERQLPSQLSGGEQQRVALARAIVIRPRVLLFDEPLSNLDARLRVQMRGEIQGLQKRLGITSVYVTHDQEEAMAISDRIAVMNKGRVVQVGSAEDLYLRPQSGFVARFIGRINTLDAQVLSMQGGTAEVQALGRRLVVAQPGPGVAVGQAAQLMVRPEALRVVAADDPAGVAGHGDGLHLPGREGRAAPAVRGSLWVRPGPARAARGAVGWSTALLCCPEGHEPRGLASRGGAGLTACARCTAPTSLGRPGLALAWGVCAGAERHRLSIEPTARHHP